MFKKQFLKTVSCYIIVVFFLYYLNLDKPISCKHLANHDNKYRNKQYVMVKSPPEIMAQI